MLEIELYKSDEIIFSASDIASITGQQKANLVMIIAISLMTIVSIILLTLSNVNTVFYIVVICFLILLSALAFIYLFLELMLSKTANREKKLVVYLTKRNKVRKLSVRTSFSFNKNKFSQKEVRYNQAVGFRVLYDYINYPASSFGRIHKRRRKDALFFSAYRLEIMYDITAKGEEIFLASELESITELVFILKKLLPNLKDTSLVSIERDNSIAKIQTSMYRKLEPSEISEFNVSLKSFNIPAELEQIMKNK